MPLPTDQAARCVTMSHVPEASVVKSVRLPRALVDRLTVQAEAEHRTVNNLITKLLSEALDLTDSAAHSERVPDSPITSTSKDAAE